MKRWRREIVTVSIQDEPLSHHVKDILPKYFYLKVCCRLVAVRQLNQFDDLSRTEQSLQRVIVVGLHYTLKPPLQANKGQGPLSRAVKWCFRPFAVGRFGKLNDNSATVAVIGRCFERVRQESHSGHQLTNVQAGPVTAVKAAAYSGRQDTLSDC